MKKKLRDQGGFSENANTNYSDSFDQKATKETSKFDIKRANQVSRKMIIIENDSTISPKDSIGDISTSVFQMCDELKKNLKKKKAPKRTPKNTFGDLLAGNLDSVLNVDLKSKIDSLQMELDSIQKGKEKLTTDLRQAKEDLKIKNNEIDQLKLTTEEMKEQFDKDLLKFQQNYSSMNISPPCNHEEELKNCKNELSEKDSSIDILNFKIEEIKKIKRKFTTIKRRLKHPTSKKKRKNGH